MLLLAFCFPFRHDFFDLIGRARQARGEQFVAGRRDEHVVLDAHADIFLGNVNSRLDGDDHSRFERARRAAGIVHVQANVMAQAVNVVAAQRAAFLVLAVRIDVIHRDFLEAGGAVPPSVMPGLSAASAAFCAPSTIS